MAEEQNNYELLQENQTNNDVDGTITHADGSCGVGFSSLYSSVCFSDNIPKTDAATITNLDIKCSTMSPGNLLILGQKEGHNVCVGL